MLPFSKQTEEVGCNNIMHIRNKTFWHFHFEIQRNGCESNYVFIP